MLLRWRSGKESTCQRKRQKRFITESGRSSEGENGNPFQYSCLENSMDRGSWKSAVHGVAKGLTGLGKDNTLTHLYKCLLSLFFRVHIS